MVTTIQLEDKLKHKLEEIKMYPRETYNQVIERLLKNISVEKDLSPENIRNIERALEDVKKGRTYSTETIKKKLGLR